MITKLAIFEGTVKPGQTAAMRAFVEAELAPLWRPSTARTGCGCSTPSSRMRGAVKTG